MSNSLQIALSKLNVMEKKVLEVLDDIKQITKMIEWEKQGLDGEQKAAESRTKIMDSQIQKEAIHEPTALSPPPWHHQVRRTQSSLALK